MDQKKETGMHGEQYVAEYLLQNGYIMKARNFHSRYGEIDLIAEKNGVAEVWVSPSDGKPVEIRYILNAFGQEEEYAAF